MNLIYLEKHFEWNILSSASSASRLISLHWEGKKTCRKFSEMKWEQHAGKLLDMKLSIWVIDKNARGRQKVKGEKCFSFIHLASDTDFHVYAAWLKGILAQILKLALSYVHKWCGMLQVWSGAPAKCSRRPSALWFYVSQIHMWTQGKRTSVFHVNTATVAWQANMNHVKLLLI